MDQASTATQEFRGPPTYNQLYSFGGESCRPADMEPYFADKALLVMELDEHLLQNNDCNDLWDQVGMVFGKHSKIERGRRMHNSWAECMCTL